MHNMLSNSQPSQVNQAALIMRLGQCHTLARIAHRHKLTLVLIKQGYRPHPVWKEVL